MQHVGPKLALAVLSVMSPEELAAAIVRGDVDRIDAVPGALRITLVIRDDSGISEVPFHGGPEFGSKIEALRYGVEWVGARGGLGDGGRQCSK